MGKALAGILLTVFGGFLIGFPSPCNEPTLAESYLGHQTKSAENLYQSKHTKAAFGMSKVHFLESQGNKPSWEIKSEFGELYRKENYAFLTIVDVLFFSDKTGNKIKSRSQHGTAYLSKNEIALEGNVQIESQKGYLFTIEKLLYDGNKHTFSSEEEVEMVGPNPERPQMKLLGKGFHGNLDDEEFGVRKNVRAEKKIKEGNVMRIRSHAGKFYTNDQVAIFTGGVKTNLLKLEVFSDYLKLKLEEEDEASIEARGKVRLKQKKMDGRAQVMKLSTTSSAIILEGEAVVNTEDNQMRGERVILYPEEERVEVHQAQGKFTK